MTGLQAALDAKATTAALTEGLAGKAPTSHTHTVSQITDFPTTWAWGSISDKPETYPPSSHTHAIAGVTGLQTALDAKFSTAAFNEFKAENDKALEAAGTSAVPPGTVIHYAGTTVPDGYLIANGALVSRTTYAKLFAAIGTKWGAGDGSTTFKLPNAEGRFLEGTTDTDTVGTYREAGLPNITGSFTSHGNTGSMQTTGAFTNGGTGVHSNSGGASDGRHVYMNASYSSSLFGGSSSVQPSAMAALVLIKT